MLNIAFLLATTGSPLPAETTSVSTLSTLTAGLSLTLGSCPKVPETERPLILSPMSTWLDVFGSLLPQAPVTSSKEAARNMRSRRRTKDPIRVGERQGAHTGPDVFTITGAAEGTLNRVWRPWPGLHAFDQLVHPLVVGAERVLAQHRALRLVVELEVHPVDGEVPAALLGPLDELATQPRPSRLR